MLHEYVNDYVTIVYYFQIWNKKEHNIIIRRFINSPMNN